MAFALNALATGQAAAGSPTSGAFTATANGNIYVFVCITGSLAGEAAPTSITCTDGGQGAFNLVYSQVSTALSQTTVAVYRSVTSGSPTAGATITANVNAGNTDCELVVLEVPSGFDTVTPTAGIPSVPVKGATTTPLSVTLSATPLAADIVVGVGSSRNRLSASPLTAGTAASFSIPAGFVGIRAASPSATIAIEKVTGYTGTTVDMGNFNTVYSDLNAFIIKAATVTSAPSQQGRRRRPVPTSVRDRQAPQPPMVTDQTPALPQSRRRPVVVLRARRNTTPVPAQVVATPPALPLAPVRRHPPLLPKLQRRPAPAPVPAQVVAAGLVYPLPPVRRRRPLPPPVRDRQAPQTVNAPQPFPGIVRRRTAPLAKVQRRALTPVPAPVVLAAPAFVPQPARRRLPLPHMSVRQLVTPVPDQVVVAVAGIVFAPVRRARLVLAKLTRRAPQVTPAPVVYVPVLNRRRRPLPPVVRDRQAPVPPPTVAALVGQPKRRRQPAPKLTRRAIRDIYANTTAPVVIGGGYAGIGVGVGPSAAMGTATGATAGPGAAVGATAGPSAAAGPTAGVGAGTGPTAKPS